MPKSALLLLASALTLTSCQDPPLPEPHPQMVFFNGQIYTQAEPQQVVEAIAIQNGRVLAVGSDEQMLSLANGKTQRIDLEGRPVYPGFADGHAHLVGVGTALENLDLMGTTSYAEVIDRTVARHTQLPEGEWLFGRGWDQNDWQEKGFPTHQDLSEAIPNRPVVLMRVDGHALLANQAAMEAAGITRDTADPDGGRLERDAGGNPTGVFVDNAESLILAAAPQTTVAAVKRAVGAATTAFHAEGITAVHDAGAGEATLAYLESMATEGRLKLRLHEMLAGSDPELLQRRFAAGPLHDVAGNGTLAIRAVKIYSDGALGSRGAALLEEYSDDHGNHGLLVTSDAERRTIVEDAMAAGFQVATHAIGDRGNRQTLDVYAEVLAQAAADRTPIEDHRWRIEHAQVIHPEDFQRFADLGVIPAMQAQHQTSDMPWAEDRVGPERILGAYAWRSFLDAGCVIPGGSDAPVERLDTVAQFIAAVARTTPAGEPEGGWYPGQNLSRQEALNMLTTWPAYAAFREHDLGRLQPGYRADMVVFSGDLMTLPVNRLADCQPIITIFAGEIVWVKP